MAIAPTELLKRSEETDLAEANNFEIFIDKQLEKLREFRGVAYVKLDRLPNLVAQDILRQRYKKAGWTGLDFKHHNSGDGDGSGWDEVVMECCTKVALKENPRE